MSPVTSSRRSETATTATVTVRPPSTTQTIADVLEQAGAIRSQAAALRSEVDVLHDSASQVQIDALLLRVDSVAQDISRGSIDMVLAEFSDLGFSWRDVAALMGVSVPAIQKWRRGGGSTPENRQRAAKVLAICKLLTAHPFVIQDIASWLEMPLAAKSTVRPLDLLVSDRVDLLVRWAAHLDAQPKDILDEFDPEWSQREESRFEVFAASDGQPGIRFRRE